MDSGLKILLIAVMAWMLWRIDDRLAEIRNELVITQIHRGTK
jgi:hypothetical protein